MKGQAALQRDLNWNNNLVECLLSSNQAREHSHKLIVGESSSHLHRAGHGRPLGKCMGGTKI
jgi:hypothetical protein